MCYMRRRMHVSYVAGLDRLCVSYEEEDTCVIS